MYGTCETLCRKLAAKYSGDTPLMLVIWSPEEIQALSDGMDIALTDHEIRTVLARLEDIPEDQRTESGTVAKLAMRQPFVLFKGLTFQKLCLPGAFRPGDHHNKMLRPGLCVVHASPQYL